MKTLKIGMENATELNGIGVNDIDEMSPITTGIKPKTKIKIAKPKTIKIKKSDDIIPGDGTGSIVVDGVTVAVTEHHTLGETKPLIDKKSVNKSKMVAVKLPNAKPHDINTMFVKNNKKITENAIADIKQNRIKNDDVEKIGKIKTMMKTANDDKKIVARETLKTDNMKNVHDLSNEMGVDGKIIRVALRKHKIVKNGKTYSWDDGMYQTVLKIVKTELDVLKNEK